MKQFNRREFIQLTATAIGGIMLTGCGSSGGGSSVPNGYRFYRLMGNGATVDPMGASFPIERFYGSAHISANGIITFDAMNVNKRRGLFQLGVDTDGFSPKILWERSALLVGDSLDDGRVVGTFKSYDVDQRGNIAAMIDADVRHHEEHYGAGLYVEYEQQGFAPLLIAGQEMNDGEMISSGIFGDVSFVEESIMTHVHHLPANDNRSTSGNSLVHLPGGSLAASRILTSSGDLVAGTDHSVSVFGLLDHNTSGDYTVGVATAHTGLQALPEASSSHLNITGNVNYPRDMQIMTAPFPAVDGSNAVSGEGGYGSRVGANAEVYSLLDVSDEMALRCNDRLMLSTGDPSATGTIRAITTGSAGADGNYYYTAVTETEGVLGMTLFVYDGFTHVPLLASGDILFDGGAPVQQILFGTTTKHVDADNRLVFLCSFADGTTSLVLGLPS